MISFLVVSLVTQQGQLSGPFASKCFFHFSKLCCIFSHPSVFYFLTLLRSYSHIYHSIPYFFTFHFPPLAMLTTFPIFHRKEWSINGAWAMIRQRMEVEVTLAGLLGAATK